MRAYFCDSYVSWQKEGVENANGIIRGHILKSSMAHDHLLKMFKLSFTASTLPLINPEVPTPPYEIYLTNLLDKYTIFI